MDDRFTIIPLDFPDKGDLVLAWSERVKHNRCAMSAARSVRDAVILAAGRGTRMKGLTEDVPKPMLPIAGRPLLEHIVLTLRSAGIERFVVVTGYRAERIESHFGDGARVGAEMVYRRQEVQDGTARALLLAREAIGGRDFLLGWGDILAEPSNYPALLGAFAAKPCGGVLAVNWVEDPCRGAAVYVDADNRIERIVEKPPPKTASTHWNNAGIGVFRRALFEHCATVKPSARGEYEIPDALTSMLAAGLEIYAFPLSGFWSDVGTPEDLARAERLLSRPS
jgi:NDP-sugar pyrophosphorylase family protein